MINLVAISIIIILVLLSIMLYKLYKTIEHPSIFFVSYYTVQIILAMVVFRDYEYSFYGVLWMMAAMILFSIGGLFANGLKTNKTNRLIENKTIKIKEQLSHKFLAVSMILGSFYFIEFYFRNGLSLNQLLDLDSLMDLNNSIAVERSSGNSGQVSFISRFFLVFTYLSPLIGGFNINFMRSKKSKVFCFLSLMPAFLIILVQNTKAVWIASIFLFISGYLTSNIKLNKSLPKLLFKKIFWISAGFFTFIGINYLSMILRVGYFDESIIGTINKKFTLYALGHIPAFDIWFSDNLRSIDYNFGVKTFYGIADFIGLSERVRGIYVDQVSWSGWSTNVYTAFRPLIDDFGPYLSLTFMLLMGFIMSYIFYMVKNKNLRFKGMALLSAFYFYVLYGFITSPWAYMSYILAFIFFAIYLRVVMLKVEDTKYYLGESG